MQPWRSIRRWTLLAISIWSVLCLTTYLLQTAWRYRDWREQELVRFDQGVVAASRMLYSSGLLTDRIADGQQRRQAWQSLEREFELQIVPIGSPQLPAEWEASHSFAMEIRLKPHVWSMVPRNGWSLVTEVECSRQGQAFGSFRVSRFLRWDRYETFRLSLPSLFVWLIGVIGLLLAILVPARQWQEWRDRVRAWASLTTGASRPGKLIQLVTDDLSDATRPSMEQLKEALQLLDRQWSEAVGAQQQNTEILQGMLVGVITLDIQLRVLFANRAACQLLELGQVPIAGRSIWELVRQPKITGLLQKVVTTTDAESDGVFEEEFESVDRDFLRLRASRWQASNGVGVIMTITDETRLHQLENMRREFTTNVSHELKTPLAAIKAYTETLLMGALEDSQYSRRFVERIAEQSTRLENLIQDLLKLARIQDSRAWQVDRVHLASALRQSLETYRAVADGKSIRLTMTQVDESIHIQADREAITTITNNLVGNAVRYTPSNGSVALKVELTEEELVIEVSDTGIGIAPEYHERIFERFFRVDKARSTDEGGTGLGLSIVKNMAQSLGGRVSLTSEEGKGSTFRVVLPAKVEMLVS